MATSAPPPALRDPHLVPFAEQIKGYLSLDVFCGLNALESLSPM